MGVRQNAGFLSDTDLASVRQAFAAVMALSDERGYQFHAGIHGLPLPVSCQHHNALFLPWHRAYLYIFERALQDQVPGASLPWWDWTSNASHANGLPAAYSAPVVDGNANVLFRSVITNLTPAQRQQLVANGLVTTGSPTRTLRDPEVPDELPRAATIQSVLQAPTFMDFTVRLENVHDAVHVWMGGSMSAVPIAAYDPIFWAHHSMIDRLWFLWQISHPGAGPPASMLNQPLPPFPLRVSDTLDIAHLGYSYSVQAVG